MNYSIRVMHTRVVTPHDQEELVSIYSRHNRRWESYKSAHCHSRRNLHRKAVPRRGGKDGALQNRKWHRRPETRDMVHDSCMLCVSYTSRSRPRYE